MATNATKDETQVEEELKTSTEDEAQSPPTESEEAVQTESEETLTTVPAEPEHDLEWYQKAYPESTKEALRLKKENDELKTQATPAPPVIAIPEENATLTPEQLYIRGKQKEETDAAFAEVRQNFPQVNDPEEYKRFVATAQIFGKAISEAEGRFPSPIELYRKTVIDLGWADDSQEKLGAALKAGAASPRVTSGGAKGVPTSKVTDAMIVANRRWYPNKTDAEIREELEPHIQ